MEEKSLEETEKGAESREPPRGRAPDEPHDISSEVLPQLQDLRAKPEDLLELSRESLKEVTRLTEYEDGKANRILTTFGFLSALAGAVSVALLPKTPKGTLTPVGQWACAHLVFFGLFFVYALLVTTGTSIVLWAIRPRFNIPPSWEAGTQREDSNSSPRSRSFFAMILKTHPSKWGQYFAQTPIEDIKLDYLRDYVHETYLVADKIRLKLSFLQPGLLMLWLASVVLVLWVLSIPFALLETGISGTTTEQEASTVLHGKAGSTHVDAPRVPAPTTTDRSSASARITQAPLVSGTSTGAADQPTSPRDQPSSVQGTIHPTASGPGHGEGQAGAE